MLIKLVIGVVSTIILVQYMSTFTAMAAHAAAAGDVEAMRDPSPLLHGGLALAALIFAAVLSVYRPRGLTPRGRRWQRRQRGAAGAGRAGAAGSG